MSLLVSRHLRSPRWKGIDGGSGTTTRWERCTGKDFGERGSRLAFRLSVSYFFVFFLHLRRFRMPRFTLEEIRNKFANSTDFNEIFDAFEDALEQKIQDVVLYRLLFWNNSLAPDELCLFGEKLAKEFPNLAYDTFMWLASVFEVTYSSYDNFELAMKYYRKAAKAKPSEESPYLDAADCYDPDLNIPPVDSLITFLKSGLKQVEQKKNVLLRLSYLFQVSGNQQQADYYRSLADDLGRSKN
jgi:tetratricopeptide (TPR) repeat protein